MSHFNPDECIIPQVWCGDSPNLPTDFDSKYYKTGSRYERGNRFPPWPPFLSKLFNRKGGHGGFPHNKSHSKYLAPNSLRQIKYVGETHEKHFIKVGINNTNQLIIEMKNKTLKEVENLLIRILTKSDGKMDIRAYNSILLFLYENGNSGLPSCVPF